MKNLIVIASIIMSLNLSAQTLCDVYPTSRGGVATSVFTQAFGPSIKKVDRLGGYGYSNHVDQTNNSGMLYGKAYYPTSPSDALDVLSSIPSASWVKLVLKASPTKYKTFLGRLYNNDGEITVEGQLGNDFVRLYPNLDYLYAVTMEPKAWGTYYQGSFIGNIVNQVSKCFPQMVEQTLYDSFYNTSYNAGSMGATYTITDLAVSNNFFAFERVFDGRTEKDLFTFNQSRMYFNKMERPFPSHLSGLEALRVQTDLVRVELSRSNSYTLEVLNREGNVVSSIHIGASKNNQHALSKEGTLLLTLSRSHNIYTYNLYEIF